MDATSLESLQTLWTGVQQRVAALPGSQIAWRYFKASHKDDPIRTLLELGLVFFIIRTYAQSRTKGGPAGKSFVKFSDKVRYPTRAPPRVVAVCPLCAVLTSQEIDELVSEWTPDPLLPPCPATVLPPIIVGPTGPRPRVIFPLAGQDPHDPDHPMSLEGGKVVLNLASTNFAGLAGNERIKEKAVECLRRYGVGSCGPPGFYGTFGTLLRALHGRTGLTRDRRAHGARARPRGVPHGARCDHLLALVLDHLVRDPVLLQAWRHHRRGPWRQLCDPEGDPDQSLDGALVRARRL